MTALRAAPYSLGYANLVVAKLRARNDIGWSPLSSENGAGALVQTEPLSSAVPTPTEGSRTDHTRIEIEWTAMSTATDTGGSIISSYKL